MLITNPLKRIIGIEVFILVMIIDQYKIIYKNNNFVKQINYHN